MTAETPKTAVVPDGPDAIWLEPSCCADPQHGRCWSEDPSFQECDGHPQIEPTKYVRADLRRAPTFPQPAFITSGPHLSGYRVSLGYPTLAQVQHAHEALANRDPQAGEAVAWRWKVLGQWAYTNRPERVEMERSLGEDPQPLYASPQDDRLADTKEGEGA